MKTTTVETAQDELMEEVLSGLSLPVKILPSKLFYDKRGSELFDEITELDEYYPTRTEIRIMEDNIDEMSALIGNDALLVELGSGSSVKIRLLLDYIPGLAGYVPVDISEKHLLESAAVLKSDYPDVDIFPVVADYTRQFRIPETENPHNHRVVYFPGSTIGNFTRPQAKKFLERIAGIAGENGGLLIGVDLKKDHGILNAAYNDKKGITAEFNLNILNHINKELDGSFDADCFEHFAYYNEDAGRIEMHLVSRVKQSVKIADTLVHFEQGEHIITEYSNKYTVEEFPGLAPDFFDLTKVWTDKDNLFSVMYLSVK